MCIKCVKCLGTTVSIKEGGQGIVKYLMTMAKNKPVISEGEGAEVTLIQLQMAYFDERIEGLILCADVSFVCYYSVCKVLLKTYFRCLL